MRVVRYSVLVLLLTVFNTGFSSESKPFFDFEGIPQALEDLFLPGKWSVVMIWAHDCHVCNQEVVQYAFFHEGNQTAQVIGLSIDGLSNKQKAEDFISNHDLPFNNLIGEAQTVAEYYQIKSGGRFLGTPTFMIFNSDGKIMAAQPGAVPPETIQNFIKSQSSNKD